MAKVNWSCEECFEIGREYFYQENFDKADAWFERAVAIDKDHIGFIVALYEYGCSIKALLLERLFYWMKKAAEHGKKYAKKKVLEVERRIEKEKKRKRQNECDNKMRSVKIKHARRHYNRKCPKQLSFKFKE